MEKLIFNYSTDEDNCVNLVFSVDEKYLPYLSVCVSSIVSHLSKDRKYCAYVMHTDISSADQNTFLRNLDLPRNFEIEFVNIASYLRELNLSELYIEIHVTLSTYYRFLIQRVFKDLGRVVYLDSDIVVLEDIAKLYDADLHGKAIGASLDIRECYAAHKNLIVGKSRVQWRDYLLNTLKIDSENSYFQAGVLVLDLRLMRGYDFFNRCVSKLKELREPILSDQDVLNSEFKSDVYYIDSCWNLEWQIPFEFPNFKKDMPEHLSTAYSEAFKSPAIIHYASRVKPWDDATYCLANYWWEYATKTRYSEKFKKDYKIFTKNKLKNKVKKVIYVIKKYLNI